MTQARIHPISSALETSMRTTGVWKEACPISLDRLREVHAPYITFEGKTEQGIMVVMDAVASHVAIIFDTLYAQKFPIAQMVPIDVYGGDDDVSLIHNNSSASNYRPIANSSKVSLHSYGIAIDINPVQNPYVGNPFRNDAKGCAAVEVWPEAGVPYVNRRCYKAGMLEPVVELFHQHGFREWGGNWSMPIDYHHFQTPRPLAEFLATATAEDAHVFFDWYVRHRDYELPEGLVEKYQSAPEIFMKRYR